MSGSAENHYQEFLDRHSSALVGGDYASVAADMVSPNQMKTLDGEMVFQTPAQMAEAARDFHAYMLRMRSDDSFRLCKSAAYTDAARSLIKGTHETYMLQGAQYVVQPYRNEMILKFTDDRWKGAGVWAQLDNIRVPIISPGQLRERALAVRDGLKGHSDD